MAIDDFDLVSMDTLDAISSHTLYLSKLPKEKLLKLAKARSLACRKDRKNMILALAFDNFELLLKYKEDA